MKHAFRSLAKSPGFTIVALLTLALGIGVNTSMFTIVNTLLLQPVPFAQSDELVRVYRTSPQSQRWPHAPANYLDLKAQSRSFAAMAAYNHTSSNYAAPGQPAERLRSMHVTAEFFPLLGTQAVLGRTFLGEELEPGAAPTVVLSDECWRTRFAADPGVLGREIRLDGAPTTIVGVMPANFVPRHLWGPIDLWRPLAFTAEQAQSRENNYLAVIGRLASTDAVASRDAASLVEAKTELGAIAARLAADHPETNAGTNVRLVPLAETDGDDASRYASWFVLGLAGFVFLIACANLANLQISRAAGRSREHAIRLALGASRWRLMQTLCVESIVLGVVGGALGLLFATWCNELVGSRLVRGATTGIDLPVDLRVFGFALLVSLFAVFASGLLPAWFATSRFAGINENLKLSSRGIAGGRAHHRLRQVLIVGEVALALTLLAGASVFIRGLQQFTDREPGWRYDGLLTGAINLPASRYPDNESRRAFFTRLNDAFATSPLVEHAAIASSLPILQYNSSTSYGGIDGERSFAPGTEPLANLIYVTPSFLETLGLRLIQGRFITPDDRADRPNVVVINEAMARALFPGKDPVGHRIGDPNPDDPTWFEIVGVVSDVRAPADLGLPDTLFQSYRPIAQESFSFASIAARGHVPAEQLAGELRRVVASIDPDQPVFDIISARGQVARALANFTLISRLLAGFALLGLALAAIGIYGVLANYVMQRTPEIGVRLALGAQLGDVLRLVLGHGLRLALLGAAIGLAGAWTVTHLLGTLMPALGAAEPTTLVAIVAGLLVVALLACWLPARRATQVNPLTALRAE